MAVSKPLIMTKNGFEEINHPHDISIIGENPNIKSEGLWIKLGSDFEPGWMPYIDHISDAISVPRNFRFSFAGRLIAHDEHMVAILSGERKIFISKKSMDVAYRRDV